MGQISRVKVPGEKIDVLNGLRNASEIYVIISNCTNLPYVVCDEETYDDEVFLFHGLKDAQEFGKKMQKEKNPVQIARLENRQFLGFYSMLYTIGVNCIKLDKGTEDEAAVQLSDLVTRQVEGKSDRGTMGVENPELHLTAIYFMQKLRAGQMDKPEEELSELQEEMLTHFKEGRYIVAVQEEKGLPILKQKSGDIYQPVFTDMAEFIKFNQEKKFQTAVVDYEAIAGMLAPEAKGIVVNPFGVNVQFQIKRNTN